MLNPADKFLSKEVQQKEAQQQQLPRDTIDAQPRRPSLEGFGAARQPSADNQGSNELGNQFFNLPDSISGSAQPNPLSSNSTNSSQEDRKVSTQRAAEQAIALEAKLASSSNAVSTSVASVQTLGLTDESIDRIVSGESSEDDFKFFTGKTELTQDQQDRLGVKMLGKGPNNSWDAQNYKNVTNFLTAVAERNGGGKVKLPIPWKKWKGQRGKEKLDAMLAEQASAKQEKIEQAQKVAQAKLKILEVKPHQIEQMKSTRYFQQIAGTIDSFEVDQAPELRGADVPDVSARELRQVIGAITSAHPISDSKYVTLGASPVSIMMLMEHDHPEADISYLPLSGMNLKLLPTDTWSKHSAVITEHFDKFLPETTDGKDIVVIDYVNSAASLLNVIDLIPKYYQAKGEHSVTVKSVALQSNERFGKTLYDKPGQITTKLNLPKDIGRKLTGRVLKPLRGDQKFPADALLKSQPGNIPAVEPNHSGLFKLAILFDRLIQTTGKE